MPTQGSAFHRKRIGEGTDYRILRSRFISFSVCSLCFSKSGFQSILSFDSPWLQDVLVSEPLNLPLALRLFLSSSLFILPFSQFPDFAVTLHPQRQHQSPSLHLRLAKDLHGGSRAVWAGGEHRYSRLPHQPTQQPARGPAQVRGGAQAQPHPPSVAVTCPWANLVLVTSRAASGPIVMVTPQRPALPPTCCVPSFSHLDPLLPRSGPRPVPRDSWEGGRESGGGRWARNPFLSASNVPRLGF